MRFERVTWEANEFSVRTAEAANDFVLAAIWIFVIWEIE